MNIVWFWIVTLIFALVAVAMILIILVQRPQGGGLVGAFGGASAGGTETVFGGRVGDALTYATVTTFALFLGLAITLNLLDTSAAARRAASVPANGAATGMPDMPPGMPGATFPGANDPGSPFKASAPATLPVPSPSIPSPNIPAPPGGAPSPGGNTPNQGGPGAPQ